LPRTQSWPFGAPSTGSTRPTMAPVPCAGTTCRRPWRWWK
jgi:hypothetical protein